MRGGKVEKVDVQLGVRDDAAELFEITSGIAGGDTVLLGNAVDFGGDGGGRLTPRDAMARDAAARDTAKNTKP